MFDGLGLSRVGMDDVGEGSQANPRDYCESDLVDHLPGVTGDDRGAQNAITAFRRMNLDKPFLFAVGEEKEVVFTDEK